MNLMSNNILFTPLIKTVVKKMFPGLSLSFEAAVTSYKEFSVSVSFSVSTLITYNIKLVSLAITVVMG